MGLKSSNEAPKDVGAVPEFRRVIRLKQIADKKVIFLVSSAGIWGLRHYPGKFRCPIPIFDTVHKGYNDVIFHLFIRLYIGTCTIIQKMYI